MKITQDQFDEILWEMRQWVLRGGTPDNHCYRRPVYDWDRLHGYDYPVDVRKEEALIFTRVAVVYNCIQEIFNLPATPDPVKVACAALRYGSYREVLRRYPEEEKAGKKYDGQFDVIETIPGAGIVVEPIRHATEKPENGGELLMRLRLTAILSAFGVTL